MINTIHIAHAEFGHFQQDLAETTYNDKWGVANKVELIESAKLQSKSLN